MAFSGAIKLGDLNDFIAPSQACVVNLKGQETAKIQAAPAEVGVGLCKPSWACCSFTGNHCLAFAAMHQQGIMPHSCYQGSASSALWTAMCSGMQDAVQAPSRAPHSAPCIAMHDAVQLQSHEPPHLPLLLHALACRMQCSCSHVHLPAGPPASSRLKWSLAAMP